MALLAKTGKKRFGNRKKMFVTPEHIKVEMAYGSQAVLSGSTDMSVTLRRKMKYEDAG